MVFVYPYYGIHFISQLSHFQYVMYNFYSVEIRLQFKHIYKKAQASNKTFVFGMEHGNSMPGKEGEEALIKAYVESDSFTV